MEYTIQQMLNALSLGSEYALLALGLAIVFSMMRLVNFAHGDILGIGAYSMYIMLMIGIGSPWLIIPISILAAVAGAVLFERVAFRPVRHAPVTTGLLTAFGVSIIMQNIFLLFVSPKPKPVPVLSFLNQNIQVGSFAIQTLQILEFGITILSIGALLIFLKYNMIGIAMRAAVLEFSTVRLMGIRANRVIATAFAISGFLAGVAAVFIVARSGAITPHMGFLPVLKAFIACVVGGFGSLPGAVVGGLLIGITEVGVLITLPQEYGGLKDAVVFSLIGLILVLRPQGIMGVISELGDKEE
ncbi:MAG: branched-chain amino acid ABC transporter permease [Bacteroidetes bacterium]|nr:MAG: branched-chain amino acid ABC transporter permease [Bacteroidota bacterium]